MVGFQQEQEEEYEEFEEEPLRVSREKMRNFQTQKKVRPEELEGPEEPREPEIKKNEELTEEQKIWLDGFNAGKLVAYEAVLFGVKKEQGGERK